MSTSSSATVNKHLTSYAHGIWQDTSRALANFIAPIVPTGASSGQFVKFSDKNSFQVYETLRALGGPNNRIEFSKDDPFFNCKPRGLSIAIDDSERNKAGDWANQLEEAKVKTLVTTTQIGHEVDVIAAVFAGLAAVGSVGVWSNSANDPIAEIDAQILAIIAETGIMPNKMAISITAWNVVKNHPLVKARITGTSREGLTLAQFASMLLNPAIRIEVGILSKDTKKFGAGKTASNIMGPEVLIFYGDDSPSQYDPSFAKTFSPTTQAFDAVLEFRDENNNSDVYKTNWEDDIQVVSTALARRISLT
jgi:hypothetical protein